MQALDLPNLRDTPFRLGVGPGEAVEHRSWREARDRVLAMLAAGAAHVALLGPAGSGKTLLLHTLARALQDQGRAVRVGNRGGVLPALGGDAVLLVDEGDQLDADALAHLAASKGPCVLAGPPALAERLPEPFAVVVLPTLSPDEVARFVAVRLAAAGQRRDLLQPDAVLALARLSGGAARQINALAGAAVFLAGLDGAAEVNPHHVEEAAALRDGDAPPPPPPVRTAPMEASAPEPVSTPRPVLPRERRPTYRPRLIVVAAGAAMGLLIVASAVVLANHPGKASRPQDQMTGAARLQSSQASAPVRQEPAPAKSPVTAGPPGDKSSGPAAHEMQAVVSRPPASSSVPPREEAVAPEPETGSSRVVVHFRNGAAAEADRLAAALAGADPRFSHVEARAVQETPRDPTIRFFYPEDVGAAWELEAALSATGSTWQVRNFTRYQRKPRRGTLEVWLP